jgi:DNA polymerase elongation subunit (family B)
MGPVKMWDIYIYNELQKLNIQIPGSKKDTSSFSYPGAYVVDPIVGKHKWVVSFDVTSLYPHIQMEWNISPEKLVENLTVHQWLQSLSEEEINDYISKSDNPEQIKFLETLKNMNNMGFSIEPINQEELDDRILNMLIPTHPEYIMTANGFYYKKDDLGIISKLLIENFNERKHIKSVLMEDLKAKQKINNTENIKKQLANYKVAEQGIKIMMNSEYGALANVFFRYCKYELCSSVTMNGQFIDKFLIKEFNRLYPEIVVVAGDTDSLYLSLEDVVAKECKDMTEAETIEWVDSFCMNELQTVINDAFEKIAKYVGAEKNYMKMAREKIIISALWTAKKHYAYKMVAEDDKILDEPKYGYKGLDCITGSIPRAVRELQKKTINAILDDQDVYDLMNECKEKYMQFTPEQIAFPKSCNGLIKYDAGNGNWAKGAQAHVKSALVYNNYLIRNNLNNEYPAIMNGDKIRYVWLKEPNVFNSPTFGFINRLPKDDMILDYIDYEKNYYKGYEKIITDILDRIGLSKQISKSVDINDLF